MSAASPPPAPPSELPATPSRWTVGRIIGMFFGAICLGLILMFIGVSWFLNASTSIDPKTIATAQQAMVSIKIPGEFEPELMEVIDNRLILLRLIAYQHKSGRGWMRLIQSESRDQAAKDAGLTKRFVEQLNTQSAGLGFQFEPLEKPEKSTQEIEIGGKPVKFDISYGQSVATSRWYRQLSGTFSGKAGEVELKLQLESPVWKQKTVDDMLHSIGH